MAENGQVTVPASFRKDHALVKGGKLMAVRMGDALVLVPHDGVLNGVCMRFEEALRGAGTTAEEIKVQALKERTDMATKRYRHLLPKPRSKRRK